MGDNHEAPNGPEWIRAADAFVTIAFNDSRPDWNLRDAITAYQKDYRVQWLGLASRIEDGGDATKAARERLVRYRKRQFPLENDAEREHAVDELLRSLPARERSLREDVQALEKARNRILDKIASGQLPFYANDSTDSGVGGFHPVATSFIAEGRTINLVSGTPEARYDLPREERVRLSALLKSANITSIWFKVAELTAAMGIQVPEHLGAPSPQAIGEQIAFSDALEAELRDKLATTEINLVDQQDQASRAASDAIDAVLEAMEAASNDQQDTVEATPAPEQERPSSPLPESADRATIQPSRKLPRATDEQVHACIDALHREREKHDPPLNREILYAKAPAWLAANHRVWAGQKTLRRCLIAPRHKDKRRAPGEH